MGKQKPVSLRDIAEEAGVSRMTVSLALRDTARIPPATRQRVREIADRLGYRPDPRVRRAMAAIAQSRHGGRQGGCRLIWEWRFSTDPSITGAFPFPAFTRTPS